MYLNPTHYKSNVTTYCRSSLYHRSHTNQIAEIIVALAFKNFSFTGMLASTFYALCRNMGFIILNQYVYKLLPTSDQTQVHSAAIAGCQRLKTSIP